MGIPVFEDSFRKLIRILTIVLFVAGMTGCRSPELKCYRDSATDIYDGKPSFRITEISRDDNYGYAEKKPVKVGYGPAGEKYYLDQLSGPDNETISYRRKGTCCSFETANPTAYKGKALLDIYEITYNGPGKPVELYLDMYEHDCPKAPKGLNFDLSR